ncbi:galactose-binding protein [Elizabethkingia anophelis]|nr:galactose-binding protein [Elizabethkingia anophelis]
MGKINWTINGKNFDSFGIGVSASRGFGDLLKQKDRPSYNWPGQNGKQYNLDIKPKYEERTIELDCFVIGNDWNMMEDQFRSFSSEFDKKGTQRLIVEIFSYKPRVYDVILSDKTILNEVKKEGKSAGTFTLKLVEPSPVKRILYTESTTLQLSFNTPSSVIINIDGKAQQAKGDVSINTNLPARDIVDNYLGRNLILQSNRVPVEMGGGSSLQLEAGGFQLTNATEFCRWNTSNVSQGLLTLSFKIKRLEGQGDGRNIRFYNGTGYEEIPNTSNITSETIVKHSFRNSGDIQGLYMTFLTGRIEISWMQLESGNKATDWTPAPEDQHYISISGNIDEITNLNTNAQILWEKL